VRGNAATLILLPVLLPAFRDPSMKKIAKILIGLIVAVIVLIGIAVVAVSFIDANRYKPQIEAKVRETTHREIAIGDIHLSIFPVLGVRLRDVKLANAPGFGDEPFAAVGTADVGVRLLPLLLHRRAEIAKVELVDARFNLATAADGRNNWDDLTQKPPQPANAQQQQPPTNNAGTAFTADSITIQRAALHYDDRKSGSHYAVDDFNFKTGSIKPAKPFDVTLSFKTTLTKPALTAQVSAQGKAHFDQAQKTYGIDKLDLKSDMNGASLPNGKLSLLLKGDIAGGPDSLKFGGVTLAFDDTHITGDASVTNLTQKAVAFTLRVDQLDVDRYMGAPQQNAGSAAPTSNAGADNGDNTPLPVDSLDAFSAKGTLDVGTLKAKGVTLTDVQLNIDAQRGGDKREKLAAKLYGGTIAAQTTITPGTRPRYAQGARMQNISIGPLLLALNGKESLTGNGNIDLNLTGAGRTVGELKRSLNGDVSMSLRNGAVKGFNLAEIVRQGEALVQGRQLASSAAPPQTDFSALDFKGHIVNGVLHDDLSGQSPYLRVAGSGQADLVNKTIDYVAKPTIVKSPEGQGGLGNLVGLTIPVKVGGTFDKPSYGVDVQSALKQDAVKRLTDQLINKNPGLAEKLKGFGALFGGHRNEQPAQNAPPQ
jgi:uncharacterized protein involved in outer membrane biogenesis